MWGVPKIVVPWYPTTIGFPTKNDHFGVFWGYHHFRKHPSSFTNLTNLEEGTPGSFFRARKESFFSSLTSYRRPSSECLDSKPEDMATSYSLYTPGN